MPNEINSPNMNLPVPVVGVDPGPQWAEDLDSCMTIIDSHNHTPGSGVTIPPSGLNINADLTFGGNNATNLKSARFSAQGSPLSGGSDLGCAYVSGVDLYYNDENGNQIRITQNGAVAGTPGSIANLLPPASVAFNSGPGTYIFESAAATPGNIDAASITVRNQTLNGHGVTLSAPGALGFDYSITLPSLPATTSTLEIDPSGNITATGGVVPAGGIIPFGGTSAPSGYLLCDGTSYLRSTYPNLFSAIGTAYGTADGTHFNVPDLRGMFLRGVDGGSGNDPDATSRVVNNPGGNVGGNVGSQQPWQIESHSHGVPVYFNSNASAAGATSANTSSPQGTAGTTAAGGNQTNPINVYVNYIIKT